MISGLREACRLLAHLRNEDESAAVAFSGAVPSKVRPPHTSPHMPLHTCLTLDAWHVS